MPAECRVTQKPGNAVNGGAKDKYMSVNGRSSCNCDGFGEPASNTGAHVTLADRNLERIGRLSRIL